MRLEIHLDGYPVDPEAARKLAEATDDAALADFLKRVADDAERLAIAATPAGVYAGVDDGPDPLQVESLVASLNSVDADRDLVHAILSSQPEVRLVGVDWMDLARHMATSPEGDAVAAAATGLAPDYLDAADPVLAALRHMEPPPVRKWRSRARPNQLPPPGDWLNWLILAGRGFGKTWTGANVLAEWAVLNPGDYALVAPTFGDARKICVEEPRSGLLAALGDDLINYNKADFVVHVKGGSRIILASADAPDRLRGYNFSGAWLDELASFKDIETLWGESLQPALRIGRFPRTVITTTPRRGNPVLKELLTAFGKDDPMVRVTRGATRDNFANLSEAFVANIYKRYAGTSLGRQELDGEMLEEVEGALIKPVLVEATRVLDPDEVPPLRRIVVGVDPSGTDKATSDKCGIVVVGIGLPNGAIDSVVHGEHLYFLEDRSLRASPEGWARRVLEVAHEWGADAIVAEKNAGHDMVETMIRMVAKAEQRQIPRIHTVWASKGKATRAEPVAGVWEQRRAHVVGAWPEFEDCWTAWVPGQGSSPDPLDAGVWAACELMPELAIDAPREVRVIA